MNYIYMINGISVCIFGIVLSAAFCDIRWTKQKRVWLSVSLFGLLVLQGCVYFILEPAMVRSLYPIITHMPLVLVLGILSKQYLWSLIAVLTAYLCCQLRRWLALLVVAVGSSISMTQDIAELMITLPLVFILVRFAAPSVRSISQYSFSVQCQFGVIPLLGYAFDYLTQIYTDLFSKGIPVIAEFMSFVCSAAYLLFLLRTSEEKQIRSQLEQTQSCLNLQVSQAVKEIEFLRKSQEKAISYRHDLRHHMLYLSSCIEDGQLEQAQAYIHEICSEIESHKVINFCENEAANLIFSAFFEKAQQQGISMEMRAEIPRVIAVSECDLCVLFSNALENALHSCQRLQAKGISTSIEVFAYEKKGKLFFQVINSCDNDILFENGIPITQQYGHGIGVRSICALVEKYGGIYDFSVKEGQFILRISL